MHSLKLAVAATSLQLMVSISLGSEVDNVWVITQAPPVDPAEMQLFAQSRKTSAERLLWFAAPGRREVVLIRAKEIVHEDMTCGFIPPTYRVSFLKSNGTWTASEEVEGSNAGEISENGLPLALLTGNLPGQPMDARFTGLMAIRLKQLMARAPVDITGSRDNVIGFKIEASGFRMVDQIYEVINLRSAELIITNPK